MWNIGPTELIIILIVILIIFGPKNLPKIGQALGKGIKEFKDASKGITDFSDDDQSGSSNKPEKQNALPAQQENQIMSDSNKTGTDENKS